MVSKFLNYSGLSRLLTKIQGYFAPLASPALTGTPLVPTASAGTNTTQIASTAFVTTAVDNLLLSGDLSVQSTSLDNIEVTSTDEKYISFSIAKSGYTPICVAGMRVANATTNGDSCSRAVCTRFRLDGSNFQCRLRSDNTNYNPIVHVYAYVLYTKN